MANKLNLLGLAFLLAFQTHLTGGLFETTDSTMEYRASIPTDTYHRFCKNIYSQNGEDGILEQLINELGIKEGTFCEFGASNGITSSNTYNLIRKHNFTGLAIELDQSLYQVCQANYTAYPNVQVFNGGVFYYDRENDLDAWLKRGNVPWDLDVLSIDIDCDDYYVWENLTDFHPKIVIFEVNSYRDPVFDELPRRPSHEYNIDPLKVWCPSRIAQGCSFISAIKLGIKKGYVPVSFTGNLTFVRKDLVHQLKEFPYLVSDNPYEYLPLYTHLVLWGNKWYTNTGLILNVAIRDYYLTHQQKWIDPAWLKTRIAEQLLLN
ncbi:MAG: hypothetical protein V4492_04785 [Chlamydiota bacterium]